MCLSTKMPKIETTAKELIPSTDAAEPESPIYGDEDALKANKKRGKSALKIDKASSTGSYKSLNY